MCVCMSVSMGVHGHFTTGGSLKHSEAEGREEARQSNSSSTLHAVGAVSQEIERDEEQD